MENRIIVSSTGYNCIKYIQAHIDSIESQTYNNFKHVIADDGTDDGTYDKLLEYSKIAKREVVIFRNEVNFGSQVKSWWNSLKPEDDDIVVGVDLDDELANPFVLETINDTYNKTNCWLTHGSFLRLSNNTRQGEGYPAVVKEGKLYRDYPRWLAQHLRTFRGFLWNNLNKEDLKDQNGKWPLVVGDLATTFPMLEMCPAEKIHHVENIFYLYNDLNPLNEFKVKQDIVKQAEMWFRGKPKYKELVR